MRRPDHKTTKLPSKLLEELGGQDGSSGGKRGKSRNNGPGQRRERRKAEREQKKAQRRHPRSNRTSAVSQDFSESDDSEDQMRGPSSPEPPPPKSRSASKTDDAEKPLKSILKRPERRKDSKKVREAETSPPPVAQRVSRAVKDRLAEDDAEIAALEKRLGLKGKKKLPKSFEEDGLGDLLEGLDDEAVSEGKRKRSDDEKWLEAKRRKIAGGLVQSNGDEEDSDEDDDMEGDSESDDLNDEMLSDEGDEEEDDEDEEDGLDEEIQSFEGFDSETSESQPLPKRVRENPYVAPAVPSSTPTVAKYIPPSLRGQPSSDNEALSRLRRQAQGLLNRLSEANLISILGDVEKLYRDNPRQHVTSTLVDLLLSLICDKTSLMDTFLILHAGFMAAVYKVMGTDFGAQIVQRIVEDFDNHYNLEGDTAGKEAANLMSLLSELYNFQVVGSNLVFDYIRLFLGKVSETNTELLLKIIRNSGPQLRQDDPSALKDIVLTLQRTIGQVGEANLSVRTKFMIETINNLKNNRMKTGVAASAVTSEHTVRMKKTLGSLNTRTIRASEPLRIGLKDIRNKEKKGKWWLVGASWSNADDRQEESREDSPARKVIEGRRVEDVVNDGTPDLLQLAREQRMNTDVRRAIFVTILSASDYRDAHQRLLKLRLKRTQELEIPKVLTHCAGSEQTYNPYYTLIARRLCSERKLKMAFQFSLWDLFKRMGERQDDDDDDAPNEDEEEEEDAAMSLRKTVNLAKMFGTLIADGGLPIGVLKTLNFAYLQPKTRTFVELLLITAILYTQQKVEGQRDERRLMEVFGRVDETPQLANGLQYFLRKVVSKTDVAGSKADKETVRWGCKVAGEALGKTAMTTT
ncbi:MAG: hypothetical protein M1819_005773 [Sarea resinae]|nr:MAG: hypothetical protein M1819_005773 [Sarea resinae]